MHELDQTILTALFKSQHLSPSEQLSLALTWNRVDIARSEIFVYGQEWPTGALDEAMMQALEHDRIDFVKLLLENGVSMKKFLSIPRLEELYNTKQGPSNTLGYILRDCRPHIPRGYQYTLHDIGLIWAVLTKRQQMALLMWQHGEEALAKSLVACKLYKAMAHEAAEDDLETEIYEELRNYGKEFETIALELLDFCYRQDDDQTQQMLTCELPNWSGQTCLSLAVAANHRALLAHPCSQIILADLWMGGLRTRKNTNMKVGHVVSLFMVEQMLESMKDYLVGMIQRTFDCGIEQAECLYTELLQCTQKKNLVILGLTFPFYITRLEFKTREELQQMPQTEEQHNIGKEENESLEFRPSDTTDFSVHRPEDQDIEALIANKPPVVQENGKVKPDEDETSSQDAPPPPEFFDLKHHRPLPIIFFLIGMALRLRPITMMMGRVIYCVDIIYWYLRILNILGVNKYLGPLVTMMGKMVKNMIYFVVLLLVVLMSFGVCRQAILFPNNEPSWNLAREVFFQPYFMLYGEVFADDIDPPCGPGQTIEECQTGRWITPTVMSIYLLVANILLINLLIAVFNNIFNEVNAISHQVWMFQRFTVVMEYEQKPVLPPPLIFLSHIYLLIQYCRQKVRGEEDTYDNGLKLFLEDEDMERLYDFEEECVEGYFREKEMKLQMSTEERIKLTTERVENMGQKIEDINQKENSQNSSIQALEFRLRNLENLAEKTTSHLAVIHRFMATHVGDSALMPPTVETSSDAAHKGSEERLKTIIELHHEAPESFSDRFLHPSNNYLSRRRPTRSMTEIRPDSYFSEPGMNVFMRAVEDPCRHVNEPLTEEDSPPEMNDDPDKPLSRSSSKRSPSRLSGNARQESTSITSLTEATDIEPRNQNVLRQHSDESECLEFVVPTMERRLQRADTWRRSSGVSEDESGTITSHHSHHSLPRRQLSQTQSEPDTEIRPGPHGSRIPRVERSVSVAARVTWAEPRIQVIPPSPRSAMLKAMHSEYTSITDELESVCGLLSPPRTPRLLSPPRPDTAASNRNRHHSEMSNPEMAIHMEKVHLRDAEESDYLLMKGLTESRFRGIDPVFTSIELDDGDDETLAPLTSEMRENYLRVTNEMPEYRCPRLRRSSAVEINDSNSDNASQGLTFTVTDTDAPQSESSASGVKRRTASPKGSQTSLVTETKC
ncbi:hypothetical protein B566_EDAN001947 [Ephemera danica]|nr:hypothetical protein B566_EDAN001947 [Ephemera danica]